MAAPYGNKLPTPLLVWLSGLSTSLQTKGSPVRFPVRAHAWVAIQVPSRGHERDNDTLMFLSLFSSPLLSPKINKILKKIKYNYHIIQQSHSWHISKRSESRIWKRYLHTHVHSIIHNGPEVEELKYPVKDKYINKMRYTHTMKYYSALKWKEILTYTTTRVNPA